MHPRTNLRSTLVLGALLSSLLGACAPVRNAHPADAATTTASGGQCVRIQRGLNGNVADARIAERWPQTNYGTQPAACAGNVAGASREMLLEFDTRALPAGAAVTRATITVHRSTAGAARLTAHRITSAWDERTTTWESFGASYDREPAAGVSVAEEDSPAITFDVTELVRGWQSGAYPNYGIALRQLESVSGFATSEAEDGTARPQLDVCFW